MPERFVPFAEIHRRAAAEHGHEPPPLSINSHGFVGESSEQAAEDYFVPLKTMMDRIGAERGWRPLERQDYDAGRTLRGATVVGDPEEVAAKILYQHELFDHERFLIQFTVGSLPHEQDAEGDRALRDEGGADRARGGQPPPRCCFRRQRCSSVDLNFDFDAGGAAGGSCSSSQRAASSSGSSPV